VAWFAALNAIDVFELSIFGFTPFLKTSCILVANLVTFLACDNYLLKAISGLMANLIALKAHFLIAVKTLMIISTT